MNKMFMCACGNSTQNSHKVCSLCCADKGLCAGSAQHAAENVNKPACRLQGGICACRSGGSYGGCAIERGITHQHILPAAASQAAGSVEAERAAFEAFYAAKMQAQCPPGCPLSEHEVDGFFRRTPDGTYITVEVEWTWWQLARAQPVAAGELPPLPKAEHSYQASSDSEFASNWKAAYTAEQMRAYGQQCADSRPAGGATEPVPGLRWTLKQIADLDPVSGSIGYAVFMARETLAIHGGA